MKAVLSFLLITSLIISAGWGIGSDDLKAPKTEVRLYSSHEVIAPGQPFTIALELQHPAHWHSYYVNPGTLGNIIQTNWKLPEGFRIERQGWPVPQTYLQGDLKSFAYGDTVTHLFQVTPPANLAVNQEIPLSLETNWQICSEYNCVDEPGLGALLQKEIKLRSGSQEALAVKNQGDLATARATYPEHGKLNNLSVTDDGRQITIAFDLIPELELVALYEADQQADSQQVATLVHGTEKTTLTIGRNLANPLTDEPGPVLDSFRGILVSNQGNYYIEAPFSPSTALGQGTAEKKGLLNILGLMFLGGLILNVMPCVFPVIGLKISGFVEQAGHDRKKVILHGLIFSAGVFLYFMGMATLVALAKQAGTDIGWGNQLQNPLMVGALLIIMLLLGMNMFGVFELGMKATSVGGSLLSKEGYTGTFFSGLLASVLATPCMGPFLGGALAATFALPVYQIFVAMGVMALGMSMPYLTLSAFPQAISSLPKPGAWMEAFKQGMSFLLFATAGYLYWVQNALIGHQLEDQKGLVIVIGLSLIALAAWIYGRWCTPYAKKQTKMIGGGIALIALISGLLAVLPGKEKKSIWETWSREAVEQATSEGKPVFIDFTAKWCATCLTNKRVAYSDKVLQLIKQKDIVLLKADKTKPNPTIDAEIKRYGRVGIPLNVLVTPEGEEHLTPATLTPGVLEKLFTDHLTE